eukprot:gb/GECH01003455.1/.p1 GENE.gb/GECH01003455.1/~~gb/GECH01003455.1/.p1  ORF type:complete len:933 (+),score=238.12 gb/GECH01003455.1/:1-2799(+)
MDDHRINRCIATHDSLSFPARNRTHPYDEPHHHKHKHKHKDRHQHHSDPYHDLSSPIALGLKYMGASHLFPIQRAIIPPVQVLHKAALAGDICVSAPTGSGKTLAYVIPVVEALQHRTAGHIGALILVPSRQLAQQVGNVVHDFTRFTSLKYMVLGMDSYHQEIRQMKRNGRIAVDIVVATPGRLLQHMGHTAGFSLDRLRYLVVDEVDRLLAGQYHDWVHVVISGEARNPMQHARSGVRIKYGTTHDPSPLPTPSYKSPLRKMLFSATMTNNPEQLAKLNLRFPQFFSFRDELSSHKRYVLPSSLRQHVLLCHTEHKPLAIIYLLEQRRITRSLCFTANLAATHRLYRMLELLGDYRVAEYSSHMSHPQRRAVVEDFSAGRLDLIVCSDVMARGMDLPDVRHVINYDLPSFLTTYIHRAGRTARAGAEGHVYTIIDEEEEVLSRPSNADNDDNNDNNDIIEETNQVKDEEKDQEHEKELHALKTKVEEQRLEIEQFQQQTELQEDELFEERRKVAERMNQQEVHIKELQEKNSELLTKIESPNDQETEKQLSNNNIETNENRSLLSSSSDKDQSSPLDSKILQDLRSTSQLVELNSLKDKMDLIDHGALHSTMASDRFTVDASIANKDLERQVHMLEQRLGGKEQEIRVLQIAKRRQEQALTDRIKNLETPMLNRARTRNYSVMERPKWEHIESMQSRQDQEEENSSRDDLVQRVEELAQENEKLKKRIKEQTYSDNFGDVQREIEELRSVIKQSTQQQIRDKISSNSSTPRKKPRDATVLRQISSQSSTMGPKPIRGRGVSFRKQDVSSAEQIVQDADEPKSGYLYKEGKKIKSWKRRWFVIRDGKLSYYAGIQENRPLRVIDLYDARVSEAPEKENAQRLYCFQVNTPKRIYYMCASSEDDRYDWMTSINRTVMRLSRQEESRLEEKIV